MTDFFILSGVFFILVTAIGINTLPDAVCRAHALSKAATLGIMLMLVALWFQLGSEEVGLKVFLTLIFQLITIPLSSHLFVYYYKHYS
ncbi:MAG: monovalent cation/H(+) antiporter subunit G [Chlamydiia bacterium]|nr:monovalent cation/H(+) antiporter subunit G [Chlamydiia bacterium]